jgi:superfamily II DNA or RNA helicase
MVKIEKIVKNLLKLGDKKELKEQLVKKCIKYIEKKVGDRKLQKDILRHYNLNDNGELLIIKPKNFKRASNILTRFDVSVTGASCGDILEGTSKLTRNALLKLNIDKDTDIKILGDEFLKTIKMDKMDKILLKNGNPTIKGHIYPEKRNLDTLRQHPTVWKQFIKKLGSIPFYRKMKDSERETWLYANEENTHNSVVVGDNHKIQILQFGNASERLEDDVINKLIDSRDGWSSSEVESKFPQIPGSKANKHTLFLIRSFWRVTNSYAINKKPVGLKMTIPFKNNSKNLTFYTLRDIHNKDNKDISIGVVDGMPKLSITKEFDDAKRAMKNKFGTLPPSFYKSLIQKIIRFRPKKIKFPKYMDYPDLNANIVLRIATMILAENVGSFVPDIQRFVTGKESCFKRSAVSIVEDGYVEPSKITTLFTSALLAQRVKSWNPHLNIYKLTMDCVADALESNKYFGYNIREGMKQKKIILCDDQSALQRSSSIMDELKSFDTDLGMLRSTVNAKVKKGHDERPPYMKLEHAVDHHWATGVAFFMDLALVNSVCKVNNSKTFSPLFKMIWDMSSGYNVRKKMFKSDFYKDKIIKKIRNAQKLYLISYHASKKQRKTTKGEYKINVTLNDGWLASLIGTLDVGLKPSSLVTIDPEDLNRLIAIRRPAREKNGTLTEEEKKRAIDKARTILRKGVSLSGASAPLSILKGARVKLVEITKNGKIINHFKIYPKPSKKPIMWKYVKTTTVTFKYHPKMSNSMESILTNIGVGVEVDHKKSLKILLNATDKKILRRVCYYLSGFDAEIYPNRIGREGGGIVKSVAVEDVGAFQFLLQLSKIYPGALTPKSGSNCGFRVESIILLDHVKNFVQEHVRKDKEKVETDGKKKMITWKNIKDIKSRKLWDHQKQIIKELKDVKRNRGAFVWLRVGMGKTLMVMKYIQHLIKMKKLPSYIIYTLPDSSLTSIVHEVELFGLPTNIITTKNRKLMKFHVNLITSDHTLRICEKILVKDADESLFIVDEVHKAMNDTQRTTVALNVVSLSKDFIVMTGTPVIDSKTYKLISWLKMIVPYEVNDKNYLVAANSMMTRNVETGIKVLREKVEAQFSVKKQEQYNRLVPQALGGYNTNSNFDTMKKATLLCYDTCDDEMIKQTFVNLKHGVMLVAKDIKHQKRLYDKLINKRMKKSDIYMLESGKSIVLTDETVKNTGIDYKVVIVPIKRAEGYTLTRLSVQITSVYPSNQATRTQIEGRINRIGQKSEQVKYIVVHCGVLTNIMNNHADAKSLELALMKMAKK